MPEQYDEIEAKKYEENMDEASKKAISHMVLRPLTVRYEKFFVITEDDFFELIRTTQYKYSVFSTIDRTKGI